MKVHQLAAVLLLSCFCLPEALACKYSVRDAGFVDLGSTPYRLYLYGDSSGIERLESFAKIQRALGEGNVLVHAVDWNHPGEPDAMRYPAALGIQAPPAVILISPDGRSLALDSLKSHLAPDKSAWPIMEAAATSPFRRSILDKITEAFCVVLLVEGTGTTENQAASEAVDKALERITLGMHAMAKPVENPPHLISMSPEDAQKEKILLWSLGIPSKDHRLPHVAVLYGRGRRIGPVLAGQEINSLTLINVLSLIGEDCECGLDQRTLQGTMIPLRWDEEVQRRAAAHLDFDPENPMVKLEVSQIISRGTLGINNEGKLDDPFENSMLFGYREEVISFDDAPTEAAPIKANEPALRDAGESAAEASPEAEEEEGIYEPALYTAAGLFGVFLLGALYVVIRARRTAS